MLLTGTVGTLFPGFLTHTHAYVCARVYDSVHAKKLIYEFVLILLSVRVPNNIELHNVHVAGSINYDE